MKMLSVRLDATTIHEFELFARVKHQTKSELLKELINDYLKKKRKNLYKRAIENIVMHEQNHPDEYEDIYDLRQDW